MSRYSIDELLNVHALYRAQTEVLFPETTCSADHAAPTVTAISVLKGRADSGFLCTHLSWTLSPEHVGSRLVSIPAEDRLLVRSYFAAAPQYDPPVDATLVDAFSDSTQLFEDYAPAAIQIALPDSLVTAVQLPMVLPVNYGIQLVESSSSEASLIVLPERRVLVEITGYFIDKDVDLSDLLVGRSHQ